MKSKVLIKKASYDNVYPVIKDIFDVFPLDVENKRVFIKPNILGPFEKEKAVTTHPSIISSLIEILKEKHPKEIIIGDNPGIGGYGSNLKSAKVSGIYEASRGYYKNISEEIEEIENPSDVLDRLLVSKSILEADILISLPKFKTHTLTQITGGIKNMFGILAGAEKCRLHKIGNNPDKFVEFLVDVYQVRIPDLTIMDGIIGMEGNGPSAGEPRFIGKIIASDNAVSLDSVVAAMMGVNPNDIRTINVAAKRGLGEIDLKNIEISGDFEVIENFKMPSTFALGVTHKATSYLFGLNVQPPHLISERCKKCDLCEKHCPSGALTINDYPVIDEEKCIYCYCCMELCAEGAFELKDRLVFAKNVASKARKIMEKFKN
ncbi:MAG: DUF362 domain-containing protein [Actinobacteria bacterium]|nr:DUF362 domain-containing protein [Actinomycetota bacterium]